jgi:hypothetical protein
MGATVVSRLPAEIITQVTGGTQSLFEIPSVDTTPSLFGTTEVELKVEINGTLKTVTTDYTVGPAGYITTTSAQAVGTIVRTYRETEDDSLLVTWPTANALTQSNLNKDSYQWLFLIQELVAMFARCLQFVISAAGTIYWDFKSRQGKYCADPTDAQDVATKTYVDAQDDAHSAVDYATMVAYVQGYVPNINYLSDPAEDMLVPTTQVVAAGTTRIYFPCAITDILLAVNGILQSVSSDFTFTADTNYVDLTTPLVSQSVITAFIFKSLTGTTSFFTPETIAVSAGDSTATASAVFDNAILCYNGVLQAFGTDWTHVFGTDTITFTSALPVDGTIQIFPF